MPPLSTILPSNYRVYKQYWLQSFQILICETIIVAKVSSTSCYSAEKDTPSGRWNVEFQSHHAIYANTSRCVCKHIGQISKHRTKYIDTYWNPQDWQLPATYSCSHLALHAVRAERWESSLVLVVPFCPSWVFSPELLWAETPPKWLKRSLLSACIGWKFGPRWLLRGNWIQTGLKQSNI
jgi:hypothetical protein